MNGCNTRPEPYDWGAQKAAPLTDAQLLEQAKEMRNMTREELYEHYGCRLANARQNVRKQTIEEAAYEAAREAEEAVRGDVHLTREISFLPIVIVALILLGIGSLTLWAIAAFVSNLVML